MKKVLLLLVSIVFILVLPVMAKSFSDVQPGYWAEADIYANYFGGITTGYGGTGEFKPEYQVTREQMAAFIIRAKEGEPAANYCSTSIPFPDCSADSWSCKYIKRLSELGLTTGYGATGLFMPALDVTRAQMAAFIVRATEGEPALNYCSSGVLPFTDVMASDWSCKYIKRLYELGITTGYGDGRYGPDDLVTRAQMAAFIARAFLAGGTGVAEASGVVNQDGGTIVSNSGLKVIIPQGAITVPTEVRLSTVSEDNLRLDQNLFAGATILGSIRLNIGSTELSQNAELAIPKPAWLSDTTGVFLGKIVSSPTGNRLMLVDTTRIDGTSLISSAPASPGVIGSGTFTFFKDNSACGVADYNAVFSGTINPTCRDKLHLAVHMAVVLPLHTENANLLLKQIEGSLTKDVAIQAGIEVASNMASICELEGNLNGGPITIEALTETGLLSINSFGTELFGDTWDEIMGVWLSLGSCATETLATGNLSRCLPTMGEQLVSIASHLYAIVQVGELTKAINSILIADEYLWQYYRWGGSTDMLPTYWGLTQGTSTRDVVTKIAGGYQFTWPWSCDIDAILDIIARSKQQVTAIVEAVDSDGDGVVHMAPGPPGPLPALRIDGNTSSTKVQGGTFTITGSNFTPNGTLTRYMRQPDDESLILTPTLSADSNGGVNWTYTSGCETPKGGYTLWIVDDATGRISNTVSEIVNANASCSALLDEQFSGAWLAFFNDERDGYMIGDGAGTITECSIYNYNAGTYRVDANGSLTGTLYTEYDSPIHFSGTFTSPSTIHMIAPPGIMVKVSDTSACSGKWQGTLNENSQPSKEVTIAINDNGKVIGDKGLKGDVKGRMFCIESHNARRVTAFFKTDESDQYHEIGLVGTRTGDTINGSLYLDNGGDDSDGGFTLVKQ